VLLLLLSLHDVSWAVQKSHVLWKLIEVEAMLLPWMLRRRRGEEEGMSSSSQL